MSDMMRFMVVYTLFAAVALFMTLHRETTVPATHPLGGFPEHVHSWQMSKQNEFSDNVLGVLKATDYLFREYTNTGGKTVSLYIGYHGGGKEGGEIHSPKHCLPGGGWYEVSSRWGVLETPRGMINLVRSVYQKGEHRELFLYWFQVRDRSISNEYSLKIAEIVNSVLHGRRDAAFIRVSVPVETDIDQAGATGEQFIRDFEPLFREYLPQ